MAEASKSSATRRAARDAFLVLCAAALAWLVLERTRDRRLDGKLGSDEPEWIAISILHFAQFVHGGPPPGHDLPVKAQPSDPAQTDGPRTLRPWRDGVQATTFGYMNPCLPKLLWGALFASAGHVSASPFAFQRFYALDPSRRDAAWGELRPVEPLARRSVQALAALTGALLALAARAGVGGRTGWLAAALALGLWLGSPLVRATAGVIRTDYFMLPWVLLGLCIALRSSDLLSGSRGARAQILLGLALGVLGGLATASKLNGALLLLAVASWILILWSLAGPGRPPASRGPLAAVTVSCIAAFATFYALNPRLWGDPIGGVRDILTRWDVLMAYFQDEWAPRTGVEVARTLGERVALYARKAFERDDFLATASGIVWVGWAAALGGLGGLACRALRLRGGDRDKAVVILSFCACFVVGTIAWLPLDWERFYLTGLPALILAQAVGLALLATAGGARWGKGRRTARNPDPERALRY
jgi:hypothetical protein